MAPRKKRLSEIHKGVSHYDYKLDQLDTNPCPDLPGSEELYNNINRKKHKLVAYIKAFSKQKQNDGIFSENIVRLALDGINLNHFHKNHPNVDIAAINTIPNICIKDEIISVKSSINYTGLETLLRDTKAVKIESLFSYLLFAYNEYNDYNESAISPVPLLNHGLDIVSSLDDNFDDYEKVVNIVAYYLMFHNEDFETKPKNEIFVEFDRDITKIVNGSNRLTHGTYQSYANKINAELVNLNNPMSIGVVYIDPKTKGTEDIKVIIRKSNPITLNKYWQNLLKVWCNLKYFNVKGARGRVTKYLSFNSIMDVFELDKEIKDFPIRISISTGTYKYQYDIQDRAERTATKVNKLYVATKMRDADFKDKEKEIFNMINKEIDILEKDPNLVTKFDEFINKGLE